MMTEELRAQLRAWACRYHTKEFIASDPVQFPHRYSMPQDIEISALLTAVLSFGSRKQILRKADELDTMMGHAPLRYLLSGRWEADFRKGDCRSFYRMLSYGAFRGYMEKLHAVYAEGGTLEDALLRYPGNPMQQLCAFSGVSDRSPQKKLNMFLRWMVRRDSEVDFGIWKRMDPAKLVIPLDTHVCRVAFRLGLVGKPTFSLRTACMITEALAEVFPGDPCLGDFALFGYGVSHP